MANVLITVVMVFLVLVILALPLAVFAAIGQLFNRINPPIIIPDVSRPKTEREIFLEIVRERKRQRLKSKRELEREMKRVRQGVE